MMMPMTLRAADILAQRLYDAGIRHAFGMPGGEVLTFVDALEQAGIRFVLVRHENAGGFLAEGVHHATGAPALLVTTVGPGALNVVNVVENARQDRVPMIVVTGAIDGHVGARYNHQLLDQVAVFRTVTKASFTFQAEAAEALADRAVALATDPRPGPVHIDLPIEVAGQPATRQPDLRRAPTQPMVPAGDALAKARARIKAARKPLIIAGVDAVNGQAGPQITRTAEALGAPVITSYKAKGLIREDHPLALGGAGLSPKADGILLPLMAQTDLIIGAGYDPIEMRPGWQDPWDAAKVIDITAAPNDHYMHASALPFVGDIAESLMVLSCGLTGPGWPDRAAGIKAQLAEAFAPGQDWGPGQVIATCRRILPPDTRASCDSGAHRILLNQMWETPFPRGLVQSTGLCTMGCGLPLAMGAALAEPDRPVVGFSGDAGALMIAGELATAADLGIRPIFVVFVDRSLALIELKQRNMQLGNAGVDFGQTDFAALARALGGHGHDASSVPELETALTAALHADRFTLIAAHIDRGAYDGTF